MDSDFYYKLLLHERYNNNLDAFVMTTCDIVRVQRLFKHSYSTHSFILFIFGLFETALIINEDNIMVYG
jgi:hypothetical protein